MAKKPALGRGLSSLLGGSAEEIKTSGSSIFDTLPISSIEPNLLTDEVIEFVSRSRAFMPHFHIPLQAGSDAVLKLMRRRYDTALFASKIQKIRSCMPDAFIGVDVIVGTRGEEEAYFEEAYRFIESLDITALHVFSYSERPGTQALKIEYKVTPQEKHRRSERLLTLSDAKQHAFYTRHIGTEAVVLLEKPKAGQPFHGFTDNYIKVEISDSAARDNELVRVRLGEYNEDGTPKRVDAVVVSTLNRYSIHIYIVLRSWHFNRYHHFLGWQRTTF